MLREKLQSLLAPDVSFNAKLTVISLFFGKLFESSDERLKALEARQLEKGEKGDRGEPGPKGEKGEKGETGSPGAKGDVGPAGRDGKDGKDGKAGKQGVSVVDSEVALDGHLVLKLSDGRIIDAGPLPETKERAATFVSGNAWQITVSATPPANPQINQLWFDIS